MDTLVLVAASVALIWKVVDGIKMLAPKLNPFVVQCLAWAIGVGVAFLLRWSDLAVGISAGPVSLDAAHTGTVVLFGLALGSSSSASVDFKKAIDNRLSSEPGAALPPAA